MEDEQAGISQPTPQRWRRLLLFTLPVLLPMITLIVYGINEEHNPGWDLDELSLAILVLVPGLISVAFMPMRFAFKVIALIAYIPIMVPSLVYFLLVFACVFFRNCL